MECEQRGDHYVQPPSFSQEKEISAHSFEGLTASPPLTSNCESSLLFHIREFNISLHPHTRQLRQLKQKLQEQRDASILLLQHLKDLLTVDSPESC